MTLQPAVPAVVVDASAMVEMLTGNPTWQDRFASWLDAGALILAPTHFRLETTNALLRSVRLEPIDVVGRVRTMFAAGVDITDRGLSGIFDALELADRHGLTLYDAAYLSLVLDVDGELATQDRALSAAARAEGVPVID